MHPLLALCAPQASSAVQSPGSSSGGAGRSWVSSLSAVWRNLGVASAKGPLEGTSTKEAKDSIEWDVSSSLTRTTDQSSVTDSWLIRIMVGHRQSLKSHCAVHSAGGVNQGTCKQLQ